MHNSEVGDSFVAEPWTLPVVVVVERVHRHRTATTVTIRCVTTVCVVFVCYPRLCSTTPRCCLQRWHVHEEHFVDEVVQVVGIAAWAATRPRSFLMTRRRRLALLSVFYHNEIAGLFH